LRSQQRGDSLKAVVTDLAEVSRLGTAKAKENLAFRRHLSARNYADEPFQILASEVQQHVDCTNCANCCRNSVVPVNKPEIENIASYLGVTPEAAAHLYTVPDPDAPASRILRDSGDACVFLDGNLCMIYEARPKTCHDFPSEISRGFLPETYCSENRAGRDGADLAFRPLAGFIAASNVANGRQPVYHSRALVRRGITRRFGVSTLVLSSNWSRDGTTTN
jgi:Fe-S-cluster containining protein